MIPAEQSWRFPIRPYSPPWRRASNFDIYCLVTLLQVLQCRPGRFATGVATDHAAALFAAARAMALTRRAIWDSDSPNTLTSPPTPAGRMAERACMAAGVTATTAPWASARSSNGRR